MVHRPADSRLLANLLSQEKDYAKHLSTFLDQSNASLASVTAYASASSPDSAQLILAVAAYLASADDALRHYAGAVDRWRDYLKGLKSLEDEVGNIMRDREILVTRLIKASKAAPHSSASPAQSQTSLAFSTNSNGGTNAKLTAAQTELQACEAHLATKEAELRVHRAALVSEGLAQRCRALAECGQRWSEAGRLGAATAEGGAGTSSPQRAPSPNQNKPLPGVASSDISLAPSQSASQINLFPSSSQHIYSESGLPAPSSLESSSSHHPEMTLPAAHAMSDLAVPFLQRPLFRRITEEDLSHPQYPDDGEGSSAGEEESPGSLQVVENPRFAAVNRASPAAASKSALLKRQTYGGSTISVPARSGSGFFGTLRGLFGRRGGSDFGAGAGGRRGKGRDVDEDSEFEPDVRSEPLPTIRPRVFSDVGSQRRRGLLKAKDARTTEKWVDGQGLLLVQQKQQRKTGVEDRGWASDGGGDDHPTPVPVKRRKSTKKQGTGAATVRSAASANSAQSNSTEGDLVTFSPRGKRRASLGVTASSAPAAAALVPPVSSATTTTRPERRQSMPVHPHPAESASLMSIVESVSRANREGWAAHNKQESGESGSLNGITGLTEVKAPALRRDDTVVFRGRTTSTGTIIEGLPRAPGSIFSSPSVPSTFSGPESAGSLTPSSSLKRPAKSPFRSALRTASPPRPPVSVLQPIKAPAPMLVPVPIPVPAPVLNGAKGKGKAPAEQANGDDSDDAVSISSYETGHEMFGDEQDGEETEHETEDHGLPPPPPPPHKYGNGTVIHESPVESHGLIEDYGHGGSDLSASSASTQTGAALPRRKSVRVSLQPTFSATPPAIDDDDDDAGSLHAPWQERKPAVDMWEDSSEEDVEYQQAKKLLSRVARKEKKKQT